jgi:hypothetical protein
MWLALTLVALGCVAVFGNCTPRWEDWLFVPYVTGAQPVSLPWLWECVQGHRWPIMRLVFAAGYSLFGFNSKPILYLHVLLFSALSLGLLWAVRQVRGRWDYCDAFIPIVLLNLGQAEAFYWAQVFTYVSGTCLEVLLLLLIATAPGPLGRAGLMVASASLVLLPLTFGGGLVFAAVMVPWLIYQGWLMKRAPEAPGLRVHRVALAAAALTALIIGLYFVGYRPLRFQLSGDHVKAGLYAYAKTSVKYLSTAFGGGAVAPFRYLPGFLVVAIVLAAGLCLLRALTRGRLTGDPRAVGLASFLAACLAVTAVVGLGRYSWGETVLESRYAATSVVVLLACYITWELYAPANYLSMGRMLVFAVAGSFLYANLQLGHNLGARFKEAEQDFLRDVRAAEPIPRIVAHHAKFTYYSHRHLEGYLRQLRDAGIAPYDLLPPDRPFPLHWQPKPTEIHGIDWDGSGGHISGPDPYLGFTMERPRYVSGLRFRFSQDGPNGMFYIMRVGWQKETMGPLQYYTAITEMMTGPEAEIVVYIDDKISKFVIAPHRSATSFRLSNIELLVLETIH